MYQFDSFDSHYGIINRGQGYCLKGRFIHALTFFLIQQRIDFGKDHLVNGQLMFMVNGLNSTLNIFAHEPTIN